MKPDFLTALELLGVERLQQFTVQKKCVCVCVRARASEGTSHSTAIDSLIDRNEQLKFGNNAHT
jgi:hypothetical protein